MKINCIIVDDEPLALDILESFIQNVPELNLVKKCRNAIEASEILRSHQVDLMFLDIQMPEVTGLDFLKSLDEPPVVVLTTAYSEYAVEAFSLHVLDYLLKPISKDRFMACIDSVKEYLELRKNKDEHHPELEEDHLFVKADQKLVRVNYNDIKYVEAFADYVKIYTDGKRLITLLTMKKMEEQLPDNQFCRVHRSFIVSLSKIKSFNSNEVEIDGTTIPVGKHYRDHFVELINNKHIVK